MKKDLVMILGIGIPAVILMIIIGGGGHTSFDFEGEKPIKSEPLHISGYKIETVAENLSIPWSIDWTPDGTALFTERNGNLRAIQNGELIEKPLLTLGVGSGEGGLLGVAVDPDFEQNNYIYLYYTYTEFTTTLNKMFFVTIKVHY